MELTKRNKNNNNNNNIFNFFWYVFLKIEICFKIILNTGDFHEHFQNDDKPTIEFGTQLKATNTNNSKNTPLIP